MSAIDSNNIWLVGWDTINTQDKPESLTAQGVIFYWNGKEWNEQYRSSNGNFALLDIDMLNLNYGWAVGGSTSPFERDNVLLFWNGREWKLEPINFDQKLRSVCIVSEEDVWGFGDSSSVHILPLPMNKPTVTILQATSTYTVQFKSTPTPQLTNTPQMQRTPSPHLTKSTIRTNKPNDNQPNTGICLSTVLILILLALFKVYILLRH